MQREVLGITISSHRDLETLLKGASPEQLVQRHLAAEPKLANMRSKLPDPHALSNALHVIAHAKEVSHPDN